MVAGTSYDTEPLGGLGGMGIVQLMVPPGENLVDGTNTRLDDNIKFFAPGSTNEILGAGKRQLLAWRGFPDATGTFVDDAGNPTWTMCPQADGSLAGDADYVVTGGTGRFDGATGVIHNSFVVEMSEPGPLGFPVAHTGELEGWINY